MSKEIFKLLKTTEYGNVQISAIHLGTYIEFKLQECVCLSILCQKNHEISLCFPQHCEEVR